jgi:hypothetical protein
MAGKPVLGRKEEKPQKRIKTDPEKDRKHAAYAAMIAQGMSKSQAAKTLGYSLGSIGALDKAIQNKGQKIGLLTESRIKKAYKVVDRFMSGRGIGDVETVKDSTVLRAAEMVIERADPKVQESGNTNINFTQINLGQFEAKPTEIDVTPIDVPETAVNDPGK